MSEQRDNCKRAGAELTNAVAEAMAQGENKDGRVERHEEGGT